MLCHFCSFLSSCILLCFMYGCNKLFYGTNSVIQSNPWSFYMQICYMRDLFFGYAYICVFVKKWSAKCLSTCLVYSNTLWHQSWPNTYFFSLVGQNVLEGRGWGVGEANTFYLPKKDTTQKSLKHNIFVYGDEGLILSTSWFRLRTCHPRRARLVSKKRCYQEHPYTHT
jgi:hypothetical protein